MPDEFADKAREALQRTAPHPADARVRIARDAADLIAIYCEGVSAVIWKRDLPQAVKDAVANMNTAPFPNACDTMSVNFTGKSHAIPGMANKELEEQVPTAVKADMKYLSQVFLQAVNANRGQLRENVSFQNPDPKRPCRGGARVPHVDGFDIRLNTIYSTQAVMGTEWYPVPMQARDSLRDEFRRAADPMAVKQKYGMQQISTGDVTIFKGGNGNGPAADQFLHSEPLPRPGVFRLGYLIGV